MQLQVLNKDPDYKRDSSSHFCRTVSASTCINDAGMLSKWKVNVLESVYQEIKTKVSRKKKTYAVKRIFWTKYIVIDLQEKFRKSQDLFTR